MAVSYTVAKIYTVRLPKQFAVDCVEIVTHIFKRDCRYAVTL